MIFMLKYDSTHIFHCAYFSRLQKMSHKNAVLSQARQIAATVLFAPLSNSREGARKLTGISNKTLSRIKAESEKWSSRLGSHEAAG